MSYPFLSHLTLDTISDYTRQCVPTGDWVSYIDPIYGPTSVSPNAGRFNEAGTTAYYIASGVWVAQKEVPKYPLRDLYRVSSHELSYLDLYQLSIDRGFHDQFLRAKEDDGWLLCQAAAKHITASSPITGIAYGSYQAHKDGLLGLNMVILPQRGQVIGDTFFIKS